MREIKFRIWDKEKGIMLRAFPHSTEFKFQNDPFITMQYTGLKDKNGKEIYEGDIIKCEIYGKGQQIFKIGDWFRCEIIKEIGEDLPRTRLESFIFSAGWRDITGTILSIEISGNIYQNPELLT